MYDYVIVGAGSAGCVLANRLTEDPDVSVLLLEAGGPDTNELVHLPAAFSALYRTAQDWDHSTIYEPFANDRRIYLPRGKVLGGSSSINAMVYMRGNPLDYDEWGPGWTWDEMLPYFKRSEDNESGESDFHGAGGPPPGFEGRSRNPPGERRRCVPAPRHDAAEPDGRDARARALDPVRGRARRRRGRRAAVRDDRPPRGARGDRVRRLVQLAAAADALRPRAPRRAGRSADRGGGRAPGDRAEPARPPERRRGLLDRRGDLAVRRAERGEPCAVRGRGARAAHLERGGGGRLHADLRRARRARRPVPFRAGALPVGGARAGRRPRLRAGRKRAEAEEPRVRGAREPRPDGETADRAQLPRASGRRGVDGGRRADLHGDLRERPAGRGVHGHADRTAVEVRRGHRGARARAAADALPPGRNLPDGRRPGCGRGPRAARARRQRAAGGGRVRDSFHPARQHQRPCDRAGGASRRPDQGRGAGGRADGAVTDAGLASSRG